MHVILSLLHRKEQHCMCLPEMEWNFPIIEESHSCFFIICSWRSARSSWFLRWMSIRWVCTSFSWEFRAVIFITKQKKPSQFFRSESLEELRDLLLVELYSLHGVSPFDSQFHFSIVRSLHLSTEMKIIVLLKYLIFCSLLCIHHIFSVFFSLFFWHWLLLFYHSESINEDKNRSIVSTWNIPVQHSLFLPS